MELLVPGGDVDCIKAAILAGADAVYCGLDKFNARNRAANISFDELQGVIRLAHQHHCKVFLTLNILILENEIAALVELLNKLANTKVDGLIVQDLGLLYILHRYFPSLQVHASTQMTTHNPGQIKFLGKIGVHRVNLSRELNLNEIKQLTSVASEHEISTEVFVHGSQCLSFSGICYMSSYYGGNSGNRGRCSQPCRDRYRTTLAGKEYPLNLKDNAAYTNIGALSDAGVYSLKIEGRIKKSDYIYTVTNTYRKQLDSWLRHETLKRDSSELYKVFNRDFSNAYLTGNISKEMFVDNPRDHSIKRLAEVNQFLLPEEKERAEKGLYDEKDRIKAEVDEKIKQLSIEKMSLSVFVSGRVGSPLKVTIKTDETSFDVYSKKMLTDTGTEPLGYEALFKRLKAINEAEYYISDLNLDGLEGRLYLPFSELTKIKNQVLYVLNDKNDPIAPVRLPAFKNVSEPLVQARMSVIIYSIEDFNLLKGTDAIVYFKLPSSLKTNLTELVDAFRQEPALIPWFPAIIIGDDYQLVLEFLDKTKPKLLVTDNTVIAFEACEKGIGWIAGPSFNLINSYSLMCLKKHFNCSGAFISNEISKNQIKSINKPEGFLLFCSIFHPELLMTTRQCLSHQIVGCDKNVVDESCIRHCEKSSSITNSKGISFGIEKSKGNYHRIYGHRHCLNTEIVTDMHNRFHAFVIDLNTVKTETIIKVDKTDLLHCFKELISGKAGFEEELHKIITSTTNSAYRKGI